MSEIVEVSPCCHRPIVTASMLGRLLHTGCALGRKDPHTFEECYYHRPLLRDAQRQIDRWTEATR